MVATMILHVCKTHYSISTTLTVRHDKPKYYRKDRYGTNVIISSGFPQSLEKKNGYGKVMEHEKLAKSHGTL